MKEFETTVILKADLPAGKVEKIQEKVKKVLDEGKATVNEAKDIGRRRLAFPINKQGFGHYLFYSFSGNGQFVSELERILKYDEDVVRYLTVKVDEWADGKTLDRSRRVAIIEEASVENGDFWGEVFTE